MQTNNKIGPGANENTNYGPYYQSKRLDLYNKYADKLIEVLAAFFFKLNFDTFKIEWRCLLLLLYSRSFNKIKRRSTKKQASYKI